MNIDAERQATAIRIRAEVKAGGLLAGSDRAKGAATRSGDTTPSKLSDMGVSKDQSSKWQKMASIPKEEREGYLAQPGIPSTEGMIRAHDLKKNPPPASKDA